MKDGKKWHGRTKRRSHVVEENESEYMVAW